MARNVMLEREAFQGVYELMVCSWFEKAWNTLDNTKSVQCCFEKAGFKPPKQVSIIISASESAELHMVPEYDGGIALFTEEKMLHQNPFRLMTLKLLWTLFSRMQLIRT